MVMVQAAPDPLESIFRNFEKTSGWILSEQAKIILKEGLIAAQTDTLGMGNFAALADRDVVSDLIVKRMPDFLEELAKKADTREKVEKEQKTIGGVFVLQNMDSWKTLFGCTCWPV